jgi:hypothetical protein
MQYLEQYTRQTRARRVRRLVEDALLDYIVCNIVRLSND